MVLFTGSSLPDALKWQSGSVRDPCSARYAHRHRLPTQRTHSPSSCPDHMSRCPPAGRPRSGYPKWHSAPCRKTYSSPCPQGKVPIRPLTCPHTCSLCKLHCFQTQSLRAVASEPLIMLFLCLEGFLHARPLLLWASAWLPLPPGAHPAGFSLLRESSSLPGISVYCPRAKTATQKPGTQLPMSGLTHCLGSRSANPPSDPPH